MVTIAVYVIGDLHLSLGTDKSMEAFAGWQDYVNRIEKNWRATVKAEDTVVLLGDTSWAISPEQLLPDFRFIEALPGQKVLIKGNHDYWWSTMTKMQAFLEREGLHSLHILHNNSYVAEGLAICGTRGWMLEEETPHDQKLSNREAGRFEASIKAAIETGQKPVAFLHYPPLFLDQMAGNMIDLLLKYKITHRYYAHLHAASCSLAFSGQYMGIRFELVSADHIKFAPRLVEC